MPARAVIAGTDAGCAAAIAHAEAQYAIPDAFLSAIGRVESGRPDDDGRRAPWPWTVNAAGQGHFYASKAEAIAAVRSFQASGIQSVDVGCLQVNLLHHPDAFPSLEAAFDPETNAHYAARFLLALHAQTGSWPHAAAAYHSQTPSLGAAYQDLVLQAWAEPSGDGGGGRPAKAGPRSPPAASRPPALPLLPTSPGGPALFAGHGPATGFVAPPVRLAAGGGFAGGAGRDLAAYRAYPVRFGAARPVALSTFR